LSDDVTDVDLGVLAEQARLREEILEVNRVNREFLEQINSLERQRVEQLNLGLGIGQTAIIEREKRIDQARTSLDLERDSYRLLIRRRQELEELEALGETLSEQDQAFLDNAEELLRLQEQQVVAAMEFQEATEASLRSTRNVAESLGRSLGISNRLSDSLIGGLIEARAEGAEFADIMSDLSANLQNVFSPANILASGISKISQGLTALGAVAATAVFSLDNVRASFIKTSGSTRNITGVLSNVRDEFAQLGVNFEDAGAAANMLFTDFNKFANASDALREDLVGLAATNAELGVSLKNTASLLDIGVNAFGMSIEEANMLNKTIQGTARDIGKSFDEVTSDFIALSGQLLVYGDRATDIFFDLEKQSKLTGIAVADLASMFGTAFDTFEGSAQVAGRLNALLGRGVFNATELLYANEAERVKIIATRLKQEGKMFDNMEKFEKLTLANALGIKDLSKVSRLLNAETGDLTEAQRKQIASENQRNELMKASKPIMEDLKNAFLGLLTNAGPLVDSFKSLATSLGDAFRKGGPLATLLNNLAGNFETIVYTIIGLKVVSVIGGLAVAFTSLAGAVGLTVTPMMLGLGAATALAIALAGIAAAMLIESPSKLVLAFFSFAGAITAVGKSASLNTQGLLALGAAALMIGGGVFLAAEGIAAMASAMAPLSGGQLAAVGGILLGIGAGIGLLATASGIAALPLLALGGALLMVGGGVALVGLGINMALQPFAEMLQYVNMETALAFTTMAGGIGLMATSLIALAASLALIKSEDLASIADILKGISAFSGTSLQVGVNQVKEVMDKSVQLAKNPEGAEAIKEIFEAARAASLAGMAAATATTTTASPATLSPTGGRPIQINLVLDRSGISKIGEVLISERDFREKITGEGF